MKIRGKTRRILIIAGVVLAGFTLAGFFYASRTYVLYNSYPDNSVTWTQALIPALLDWYTWAIFFVAVLLATQRFPIQKGSLISGISSFVAIGGVVVLGKTLFDARVGRAIVGAPVAPFAQELSRNFHPNLITFLMFVGLIYFVRHYKILRERELRTSQLETRLAQAQLQVLRMQLHPHFLFNTLNAISTLMHRDVDAAEKMLARLSDLLRMTIEKSGGQLVSLREELDFLRLYVEIEETRFPDRLTVNIDAGPEVLDAMVPHLSLQPLVENAIRHGIAPRAEPGRVDVSAQRVNGILRLTIKDDGLGLGGSKTSQGNGVGLSNTRERLRQLYGDRHRFEVRERASGGVEVLYEIPFATEIYENQSPLEESDTP